MNDQTNKRVMDLMYKYYDLRDKIDVLEVNALEIKKEILKLASKGHYGKFTVGECKKVKIEVKAYVRNGYKFIRKGK